MWQCPLCSLALKTHQDDAPERLLSTWTCANNHTFDKAKQGYVNLLPVQNKRSKMPGDDAQMVQARSIFFSDKPYHPLVTKLSELIVTKVSLNKLSKPVSRNLTCEQVKPVSVYDSGCGEGYYLEALSELLLSLNSGQKNDVFCYAGHDISKPAVVAASKRNKDKQLVVASTINIPIVDESQDFVIQIFAPSCASEYARILKPQGTLITVDPAPKHLFELKEMVYEKPEYHQESELGLSGFELSEQHKLKFNIELSNSKSRLALLQMTPFFWKTNEAQKAHIENHLSHVTADFVIRVWNKNLLDTQVAVAHSQESTAQTCDENDK
jgi:23S rRNA (guanine745-N1)-methyltransferase